MKKLLLLLALSLKTPQISALTKTEANSIAATATGIGAIIMAKSLYDMYQIYTEISEKIDPNEKPNQTNKPTEMMNFHNFAWQMYRGYRIINIGPEIYRLTQQASNDLDDIQTEGAIGLCISGLGSFMFYGFNRDV